jgi:monomeric isocitrate dehydrogenase
MQAQIEQAQLVIQSATILAVKQLFAERPDVALVMSCCGASHTEQEGEVKFSVSPMLTRTRRAAAFRSYEIYLRDCISTTPDELAAALYEWIVGEVDAGNVALLPHR